MSCHCNHVWHLYDLGILAPDLHMPTYCFLLGLGRWPMDMASFGGKDFAGIIKNEIILDFLSDPWIWKTPFKEAEEETDTEVLMKTRQRLEWCGHKSRDSSSYQKLKKSQNLASSLILDIWVPELQEMNGWHLKSSVLRPSLTFVIAVLGRSHVRTLAASVERSGIGAVTEPQTLQ